MANHVVKSLAEVLAVAAADGDTIYCSNPCKFYKCISDKFKVSVNATKLTNGVYAVLDMDKMIGPSISIIPPVDESSEIFPGQLVRIRTTTRIGQGLVYKAPGTKLNMSNLPNENNLKTTALMSLNASGAVLPRASKDMINEGDQEGGSTKFWALDGTTGTTPDEIEKIEFNPAHNGVKLIVVTNGSTVITKYVITIPAGTNEWVMPDPIPTGFNLTSHMAIKFDSPFKCFKSSAGSIYSFTVPNFSVPETVNRFTETGECRGFRVVYKIRKDLTIDD